MALCQQCARVALSQKSEILLHLNAKAFELCGGGPPPCRAGQPQGRSDPLGPQHQYRDSAQPQRTRPNPAIQLQGRPDRYSQPEKKGKVEPLDGGPRIR